MEFNEKLQQLRKSRGITQDDLAKSLYVSRTAISKWESGRGYPNIESLKEIAKFFSISVDDLLSGEKILYLAEKENKGNIKILCDILFGMVDLCSLLLIILPLYPNTVDGFIYSVSLANYIQLSKISLVVHWVLFSILFGFGIIKLILAKTKAEKLKKIFTFSSVLLSIITVLFLALTRETYAVVVAFLILIAKAVILFRLQKNK